MPSAGSATFKTNSTATIPKVTYVALKPPTDEKSKAAIANSGGALKKSGFIRNLKVQPGEVDAVSAALAKSAPGKPASPELLALAKSFESSRLEAAHPAPAQFAKIPEADLIAFGKALAGVRQEALKAAPNTSDKAKIATATNLVNTALVHVDALSSASSSAMSPIGWLNLERIEMTPAGIERGGLIATIPLAPKERTTVVQQEWSVVTKDFSSIVTDSLDNYSETGVTDTTQLSQSTASQVAHANQLNVNASASGSCGFVTASVAISFGSQDQTHNPLKILVNMRFRLPRRLPRGRSNRTRSRFRRRPLRGARTPPRGCLKTRAQQMRCASIISASCASGIARCIATEYG